MSASNDLTGNGIAAAALRQCRMNVGVAFKRLLGPAKIHPRRPWPVEPRRLAMVSGLALLIILFCMFAIDGPVARAVLHAPHWMRWPFYQITQFGKSGWFLWPLGILFLALASLPAAPTRMGQAVMAAIMVRVGFLLTAIAVPGLFVTIVKRMIGRARPMVGGHIDPFAYAPFIWQAAYASLPSGHATTAFSVLAAFGSLWPRGRAVLLLYAFLIALSRILVLAHFTSDVLAGAVVGTVGALMVRRYFALRGLGFSVGPAGELNAFPGPSLRRIKAVARDLLSS